MFCQTGRFRVSRRANYRRPEGATDISQVMQGATEREEQKGEENHLSSSSSSSSGGGTVGRSPGHGRIQMISVNERAIPSLKT